MNDSEIIKQLMDSLDSLHKLIDDHVRAKSEHIKAFTATGFSESKAIEDWHHTLSRICSQVDVTAKEIGKIIGKR